MTRREMAAEVLEEAARDLISTPKAGMTTAMRMVCSEWLHARAAALRSPQVAVPESK